jgi:hypothetical protein
MAELLYHVTTSLDGFIAGPRDVRRQALDLINIPSTARQPG